MRLADDDELYEVDQTYLGPPKRYIGEMRYRTIFIVLVVAPVSMVVLRKIGMPLSLLTVGLWAIASVWISMKAADYIGHESSAAAWAMTFWHELSAPRPDARPLAVTASGKTFARVRQPSGVWARALRRRERAAQKAAQKKAGAVVAPVTAPPLPERPPAAAGPWFRASGPLASTNPPPVRPPDGPPAAGPAVPDPVRSRPYRSPATQLPTGGRLPYPQTVEEYREALRRQSAQDQATHRGPAKSRGPDTGGAA